MLIVRKEQIESLRRAVLRSFENEMVAHLAKFSPPLFNAVKEDQMRKAVRLGMERAEGYGFNLRGPVRLYLELMLLFGSFFDADPQYPWANEILTDDDFDVQMQRAERLFERTRDYRKKVNGPNDVYTLSALRNIAVFARQPLSFSADEFVSSMIESMSQVYPEKTAFVGAERLKILIDKGIVVARRYGFSKIREVALIPVLMFTFGHGCIDDPLYPWIANTLNDTRIADPAARAKRLEAKSLIWLDQVLANYEEGDEYEQS
jgi:hypothetical protein